jgi:hypothetical protein
MTPTATEPQAVPSPQETKRIRKDSKLAKLLRIFLERGDVGLDCFKAVSLAGDYVLRSSVSELTHGYGVEFERIFQRVPGNGGKCMVNCTRYWLSEAGRDRASQILLEAE